MQVAPETTEEQIDARVAELDNRKGQACQLQPSVLCWQTLCDAENALVICV